MNHFIINSIIIPIILKLMFVEIVLAFSIVYLDFLGFSFFVILFFVKILLIFLFREPYPCLTGNYFCVSPCAGIIKEITKTKNHPLLGSTNNSYTAIKIESSIADYYSKFSPVDGKIKKINWIDNKLNNRTIKSLLITFETINEQTVLMLIKPKSVFTKTIILDKKDGAIVNKGDYICNVPFGSQVTLYLSENVEIIPVLKSSVCPFSIIYY